jgi:hypothetical protein
MNTLQLFPMPKTRKTRPIIINGVAVSSNDRFLDYSSETTIVDNSMNLILPMTPIRMVKINIINLGKTPIKIVSNTEDKIYNHFFCPKGSNEVYLEENNMMTLFFVTNKNKEGVWISK